MAKEQIKVREPIPAQVVRPPLAELPSQTLEELGAALDRVDPDVHAHMTEMAYGKKPDDVFVQESLHLWWSAERLRAREPSLPRLPMRPGTGRDRLLALKQWWEECEDQQMSRYPYFDDDGNLMDNLKVDGDVILKKLIRQVERMMHFVQCMDAESEGAAGHQSKVVALIAVARHRTWRPLDPPLSPGECRQVKLTTKPVYRELGEVLDAMMTAVLSRDMARLGELARLLRHILHDQVDCSKLASNSATRPSVEDEQTTRFDALEQLPERIAASVAEGVARAVVTVSTRDDNPAPAAELRELKEWAQEAWQAHQVHVPQSKIAAILTAKYGKKFGKITQARVSEQLKLAKAQYAASGLAEVADRVLAEGDSKAPCRTLDPAVADKGRRTDHRSAHLREKARDLARQEEDES